MRKQIRKIRQLQAVSSLQHAEKPTHEKVTLPTRHVYGHTCRQGATFPLHGRYNHFRLRR